MIGLDFPVKPEWVHQVLSLWQPEQPIGELVDAALRSAMPELGGEKTRRNSLTIILRYFVDTRGAGPTRNTTQQNVWAALAPVFQASELAPAYLAHIINQNPVASEVSHWLAGRTARDHSVMSGEVRQRVAARFGERKVTLNTASAFMRTLCHFSVFEQGQQHGEYRFKEQLPVSPAIFPLIVWSWWQSRLSPQVDVEQFEQEPAAAFLRQQDFASGWATHQPAFWVLDERIEGRRATLKHAGEAAWRDALLALVNSG